jgi:hypothetical protein
MKQDKKQQARELKGQQTGGSNDAVVKPQAQVEPVKHEAQVGEEQKMPVVGESTHQQATTFAAKAELEVPAPDQDDDLPPFDAFVHKHEVAAQERGVVVTAITHPKAPDTKGIYHGKHAGIRVAKGKAKAQYSDGSEH